MLTLYNTFRFMFGSLYCTQQRTGENCYKCSHLRTAKDRHFDNSVVVKFDTITYAQLGNTTVSFTGQCCCFYVQTNNIRLVGERNHKDDLALFLYK